VNLIIVRVKTCVITTAVLNSKHLLLHNFMNLVKIIVQLSMAEIANAIIYMNNWKTQVASV
jgi:hypothetical protein